MTQLKRAEEVYVEDPNSIIHLFSGMPGIIKVAFSVPFFFWIGVIFMNSDDKNGECFVAPDENYCLSAL